MREIMIEYNPYRLETKVLIDGQKPKQNSKFNVGQRRLQEWVEDIPKILIDECGDRDFNLTFHGTVLDFEDVEAMAKAAEKRGVNIRLHHTPAREAADKEAAISDIFKRIQEGPLEELKQPDVIKAFNLAKSRDFEVNVVATMSAGKSTLINALLQQKLMPAKQEACTATITEIKDTDSGHFSAKAYDSTGRLVETHSDLSLEIMNKLNNDANVSRIRVEGNIPFVTAEDVALVIVDTPGPNNSRDPSHKAATYRMLSESSKAVVLYILNATQLAVNDDSNLLRNVAESMKVGGKQSRDRFIFVVNKLDDFRKGEDSIDAALAKVREYLHDNGIEDPNIYPASALTALDIRTILAESDDDDDDDVYEAKGNVRKFNRNPEMHFEKLAPLTPSARAAIENRLERDRAEGDTKDEALIHCGIIPIEMAIQMYVRKYAKTAKIRNIVDTFYGCIESMRSIEQIKKNISENVEKREELLKGIKKLKEAQANGKAAKRFEERIEKLNYDNEIKRLADRVLKSAQDSIAKEFSSIDSIKLSKAEAEECCDKFGKFAEELQAEVIARLQNLIEDHVKKNAENLLNEYMAKLSDLSQEMGKINVTFTPLDLVSGALPSTALIDDLIETEEVKTGEEWVRNEGKRWYKPWTWVQEKGHWSSIYKTVEYFDTTKLADRFFTPVQERMFENRANAVKYAQKQAENIKTVFKKEFKKLDELLAKKLRELEEFARDERDTARRIRESEEKLKWLQTIMADTDDILNI